MVKDYYGREIKPGVKILRVRNSYSRGIPQPTIYTIEEIVEDGYNTKYKTVGTKRLISAHTNSIDIVLDQELLNK